MNNKIFFIPKPNSSAKIRLFCFPFAGGSATTYIMWTKFFDNNVELVLIQPPGRGSRMGEAAHDSMDSLVLELMNHAPFITNLPYILLGHSLGGRVAFELAQRLQSSGRPPPHYFIASGSRAPHLPRPGKSIYNLPKNEFIKKLESLGGTPHEVLSNAELLDLITPLLRADFKINDTYQGKATSIHCPILILAGKSDDEVKPEQLEAWAELSNGEFKLEFIDGGHFFINQQKHLVIGKVQDIIKKILLS